MGKIKFFLIVISIALVPLLLSTACASGDAIQIQETEPVQTAETEIESEQLTKEEDMMQPVMEITSPAFKNNGNIPAKYTCDGENINPLLEFKNIPQDTKSLALIVDDPDAPAKTWVHWVVWNIDPGTTRIPENAKIGDAVEGITDFGKPGYGGPCPPSGTHRYFFKLFALDTELDLDPSSGARDLANAMEGHIIESAELIGLYARK